MTATVTVTRQRVVPGRGPARARHQAGGAIRVEEGETAGSRQRRPGSACRARLTRPSSDPGPRKGGHPPLSPWVSPSRLAPYPTSHPQLSTFEDQRRIFLRVALFFFRCMILLTFNCLGLFSCANAIRSYRNDAVGQHSFEYSQKQ